jgi:hypothetical protein
MRSTPILLGKIAATPKSSWRWVTRSLLLALAVAAVATSPGTTRNATAALPPGNTVAQWNKLAEDTVVGSGAFQSEGFIYMAYASTAVYNAVVAIEGGYEPVDSTITAPAGASVDCAVVEAAYRTLHYYFSSFPVLVANLDASYAEALSPSNLDGCAADGGAGSDVGSEPATPSGSARRVLRTRTPRGGTSAARLCSSPDMTATRRETHRAPPRAIEEPTSRA